MSEFNQTNNLDYDIRTINSLDISLDKIREIILNFLWIFNRDYYFSYENYENIDKWYGVFSFYSVYFQLSIEIIPSNQQDKFDIEIYADYYENKSIDMANIQCVNRYIFSVIFNDLNKILSYDELFSYELEYLDKFKDYVIHYYNDDITFPEKDVIDTLDLIKLISNESNENDFYISQMLCKITIKDDIDHLYDEDIVKIILKLLNNNDYYIIRSSIFILSCICRNKSCHNIIYSYDILPYLFQNSFDAPICIIDTYRDSMKIIFNIICNLIYPIQTLATTTSSNGDNYLQIMLNWLINSLLNDRILKMYQEKICMYLNIPCPNPQENYHKTLIKFLNNENHRNILDSDIEFIKINLEKIIV